jgi:hypothetical protein
MQFVWFWHQADIKLRPLFGRYGLESGHQRRLPNRGRDSAMTWVIWGSVSASRVEGNCPLRTAIARRAARQICSDRGADQTPRRRCARGPLLTTAREQSDIETKRRARNIPADGRDLGCDR